MKTTSVNLRGPTIINDLTRYPTENPITVTEAEAASLKDRGLLADDEDDLDGMKLADLKALADKESVQLGEATTKADIAAAIRAHRANKEA